MSEPELDRKNLIREAFNMEGLSQADCRAIFFDWALDLPPDTDVVPVIEALLARYAEFADHPMTAVLRSGLKKPAKTGRRGGRAARVPEG